MEIEDECIGWNKFCIFPEATTTNGTALLKFKRGAFEGMRTVTPCFTKISDRMIHPTWETILFWAQYILVASSLCFYNCTLHIMPEFTPTKKMLEMHADKGEEDWEIYAECVREAMAKAGNFKLSNQPIREKLAYEDFMNFDSNEIKVGENVIYSLVPSSKVDLDPYGKNLKEPLIKN